MSRQESQTVSLDTAWRITEEALPEGYFISSIRTRSKIARWTAAATLDHDSFGASYSGFGPTPADALLALAARLQNPS